MEPGPSVARLPPGSHAVHIPRHSRSPSASLATAPLHSQRSTLSAAMPAHLDDDDAHSGGRPAKKAKRANPASQTAARPLNGTHKHSTPVPPSVPVGADDDAAVEAPAEEDFPLIRCGWQNCWQGFWVLEDLIEHLIGPEGHIPPDPSAPRGQKCPCEWAGCPKQGKSQGSRMALVVHLRSHTGEKPFPCHKPECAKTFSRTDALAKHVRVAHNEILAPSRKPPTRKTGVKGEDESWVESTEPGPEPVEANDVTTNAMDSEEPDPLTPEEAEMILNVQDKVSGMSTRPDYIRSVMAQARWKFVLGERDRWRAELRELQKIEAELRQDCDDALDEMLIKRAGKRAEPFTRRAIEQMIVAIPATETEIVDMALEANGGASSP